MHTRDVPYEEWKPFLNGFVSQHRGDRIHIETVGGGAGPKSVLCGTPLLDIASDIDGGSIDVKAGAGGDAQTHSIGHPTHLSVSESDDGNPLGLQITDEAGCVTCLRVDAQNAKNAPPGYYLG